MKWWVHAGMQFALAHTPGGKGIYEYLQNHHGELKHLANSTRFDNAKLIIDLLNQQGIPIVDQVLVELGTGWIPVIPLTLAGLGAQVHSYDVSKLVQDFHFQKTKSVMQARFKELLFESADGKVRERANAIASTNTLDEALKVTGGGYVAPSDTTHLPHKENSVDLIVSNLVLQCIPEKVLELVIIESYRVLKPGGVAVHRVRMSDEYARNDPSCHELNYLYYSDEMWRTLFTHRLKHLNRWRASQFISLFGRSGFEIRYFKGHVDQDFMPTIQQNKLANRFQYLSQSDLATIAFEVILEKPL